MIYLEGGMLRQDNIFELSDAKKKNKTKQNKNTHTHNKDVLSYLYKFCQKNSCLKTRCM